MTGLERYGSLAARTALAMIFIISGFGKLAGLEGAAAYIGSKGLPAPLLFALLAGVSELAGGLMLVAGLGTRLAALVLALFLVPATVFFHNPFGLAGAEAHMQQIHALKNIAIAGGLTALATWGAGSLSLDAWLKRRRRSAASAPLLHKSASVSG
jgi:putative oxidoreductase